MAVRCTARGEGLAEQSRPMHQTHTRRIGRRGRAPSSRLSAVSCQGDGGLPHIPLSIDVAALQRSPSCRPRTPAAPCAPTSAQAWPGGGGALCMRVIVWPLDEVIWGGVASNPPAQSHGGLHERRRSSQAPLQARVGQSGVSWALSALQCSRAWRSCAGRRKMGCGASKPAVASADDGEKHTAPPLHKELPAHADKVCTAPRTASAVAVGRPGGSRGGGQGSAGLAPCPAAGCARAPAAQQRSSAEPEEPHMCRAERICRRAPRGDCAPVRGAQAAPALADGKPGGAATTNGVKAHAAAAPAAPAAAPVPLPALAPVQAAAPSAPPVAAPAAAVSPFAGQPALAEAEDDREPLQRVKPQRPKREFQGAPIPANEGERHAQLCKLGVLDSEPDPRFDDITKLVRACGRRPGVAAARAGAWLRALAARRARSAGPAWPGVRASGRSGRARGLTRGCGAARSCAASSACPSRSCRSSTRTASGSRACRACP